MTEATGGCLCGRIRYVARGEPAFVSLCHCRHCQRFTGSAFQHDVGFPAEAVAIEGELVTYGDRGESGRRVSRRFCPHCGSGVAAEAEAVPGIVMLLGGTLDDPARFAPTMQIFCDSARPWAMIPGLPGVPRMPG